jgi:hypothetical protein
MTDIDIQELVEALSQASLDVYIARERKRKAHREAQRRYRAKKAKEQP